MQDVRTKKMLADIVKQRSWEGNEETAEAVRQANTELIDLIYAGRFEDVLELSRKHNFFNTHLDLLLASVEADDWMTARETLFDLMLVLVPQEKYDELYLGHALCLLNACEGGSCLISQKMHNRCSQHVDWFMKRRNDRARASNPRQMITYDRTLLSQFLLRAMQKAEEVYSIASRPWRVRGYEDLADSVEGYRAFAELMLFHENAFSSSREAAVLTAFQNIQEYIVGGVSSQYRQTQAKLDLVELFNSFPLEAVSDAARELDIYDVHLLHAFELFERAEYSRALELVIAVANESDLFDDRKAFNLVRLREQYRQFAIVLLSKLDEDEMFERALTQLFNIFSAAEHETLRRIVSDASFRPSVDLEIVRDVISQTLGPTHTVVLQRKDKKYVEEMTYYEILAMIL